MPCQFQTLPQCIGPMNYKLAYQRIPPNKVIRDLTLTRSPKAIIQAANKNRSIGQCMNVEVKGIKNRREIRIPRPAITSVYMKRFLDHAEAPLLAWRYWPVIPATVAEKAS